MISLKRTQRVKHPGMWKCAKHYEFGYSWFPSKDTKMGVPKLQSTDGEDWSQHARARLHPHTNPAECMLIQLHSISCTRTTGCERARQKTRKAGNWAGENEWAAIGILFAAHHRTIGTCWIQSTLIPFTKPQKTRDSFVIA